MIGHFFRRENPRRRLIETLHLRTAQAARAPGLYTALHVPDTVEGRFEALCLHVILVLRRLKALPAPADDVAQDLVDAVFLQLDAFLRELGVGDMGVGKRMKKMGAQFYGRAHHYGEALDGSDREALAAALARNVFEEDDPAVARPLADYAMACAAALERDDLEALLGRGPGFPDPGR